MAPKKPLVFEYKNWEGKKAVRTVVPIDIWYGSTKWHDEEQWLLKAEDLDKGAERDFAVNDIIRFISEH
jgi:predicted DNA-binding transcriptional regulator YafY